MTSDRTKRRHMGKAGFVPVGPVWLTHSQAIKVKAWDAANREAAEVARNTHKETKQ